MAKIGIECEVSDEKRDEIFDIVSGRTADVKGKSDGLAPDDIERCKEWFKILGVNILENDKFFNEKMSYIGTGIIALFVTFCNHGIKGNMHCAFRAGLLLVAASIFVNITSFFVVKKLAESFQCEINDCLKNDIKPPIDKQTAKISKYSNVFNIITYMLLVFGCMFMLNVVIETLINN